MTWAIIPLASGLIINGSFENFTVDPGCYYITDRAEFAAAFPHVYKWGIATLTAKTVRPSCPGLPLSVDGDAHVRTFIAEGPWRATGGVHSGVIFELSEALVPGESYTLRGHAMSQLLDSDYDAGRLRISVSENDPPLIAGSPTDPFGTPVGTVFPSAEGWSEVQLAFEAPFAARYLAVQTDTYYYYAVTNLDDFSLVPTAVPVETTSWKEVKSVFR